MHWKMKAMIQNAVCILPSSASYGAYYWIQRHFGGLRRFHPVSRLVSGIDTWKRICAQGISPTGKVFFEVGTGRVPLAPLAFWLLGAEKTITIDLNPYLKQELLVDSLRYMSQNQEQIRELFGDLLDANRLAQLSAFSSDSHFDLTRFLDLCRIEYIAPGDATATGLPENSIDVHTSYTVFEHIPLEVLQKILEEGNRIVKDQGLFIHRIDYSDHFSHSDRSISAINFLQYSDKKWDRYAGNRYMYMNRLRHDDFLQLYQSVGHRMLEVQPDIRPSLRELLKQGTLSLDDRFRCKSEEVLATTAAWITSQKGSVPADFVP
jgi:SAM-dependent methyltransferase